MAWTHAAMKTTALPNKLCSGNHKPTEKEGDHGILGEEIWSQKWEQQDSSTGGGRWRRWFKTELDGEKWSVAYAPLGEIKHKSSKSYTCQNGNVSYFNIPF